MQEKLFIFSRLVYEKLKSVLFSLASICSQNKERIIKFGVPLLVIIFGYCSCIYTHNAIVNNVQKIFMISDQIRSYYTDKSDYWGLNTQYAIEHNIVSNEYIKNDKIVLDGEIELLIGSGALAETVMPLSKTFDLVISHLNKAQCVAYAESPLSQENLVKLLQITIINKSGTYSFEWGGSHELPISKYATKDLCINNDNTITWSIK